MFVLVSRIAFYANAVHVHLHEHVDVNVYVGGKKGFPL